jgi:hypothetical protein
MLTLQENLARIEKVYDAFLAEFPLCSGYWKKYAVKAVTYSVDIWMHYCTYAMEKFDSPEKIRRYVGVITTGWLVFQFAAGRDTGHPDVLSFTSTTST